MFVKTRSFYLTRDGVTVDPGSIVDDMDDPTAEQFVERGMGDFCAGPVHAAPHPSELAARVAASAGPDDPEPAALTPHAIEAQDLGPKLAAAERAVAPRQGRQGAI